MPSGAIRGTGWPRLGIKKAPWPPPVNTLEWKPGDEGIAAKIRTLEK